MCAFTPLVPPSTGHTSSPPNPSQQRNSPDNPDQGRRNLPRFQFPYKYQRISVSACLMFTSRPRLAMARTKQTDTPDPPEAMPEALVFATRTTSRIKERLLEMEIIQSDEQMCEYLSLKYNLARMLRNGTEFLEEELKMNSLQPTLSLEDIQKITTGLEAMRKELSTVLGEIPLIICPVKNCPTHTNGTKNDSYVAESSSKFNDNNSNEQNNDSHNTKEKAPEKTSSKHNKNKPDNSQNKKRSGQENFQTPTKFARKIIEIPIEKVVCTTQNKFAILEGEEGMDTSTPTPQK
ncbi:uncharacterized protein TNCV_2508131 [Trichonephila clavipes]|nr:uncharacterized protein TNCV_2508131 [Trichonephila clavipes]